MTVMRVKVRMLCYLGRNEVDKALELEEVVESRKDIHPEVSIYDINVLQWL